MAPSPSLFGRMEMLASRKQEIARLIGSPIFLAYSAMRSFSAFFLVNRPFFCRLRQSEWQNVRPPTKRSENADFPNPYRPPNLFLDPPSHIGAKVRERQFSLIYLLNPPKLIFFVSLPRRRNIPRFARFGSQRFLCFDQHSADCPGLHW